MVGVSTLILLIYIILWLILEKYLFYFMSYKEINQHSNANNRRKYVSMIRCIVSHGTRERCTYIYIVSERNKKRKKALTTKNGFGTVVECGLFISFLNKNKWIVDSELLRWRRSCSDPLFKLKKRDRCIVFNFFIQLRHARMGAVIRSQQQPIIQLFD